MLDDRAGVAGSLGPGDTGKLEPLCEAIGATALSSQVMVAGSTRQR